MDKLLKYVDDSKYFGIAKTEDDILLTQDKLNDLYGWAENNNMKWNALKFCVLRLGKNDEIKMNTCLLTPEFEEVIEAKEVAKDLGIMIDDSLKFNTQNRDCSLKSKEKLRMGIKDFEDQKC